MKVQAYSVNKELELHDGKTVPFGTLVYEWPYEKWRLQDDNTVCVFLKPRDVTRVFFVPASSLSLGPVVDIKITIGSMTQMESPDETVRIANEPGPLMTKEQRERVLAAMLCATYWRGVFVGARSSGKADEGAVREKVREHLNEWIPTAQLALT